MIIDIHTHVCNEKIWNEYQEKSNYKIDKIISFPYFNKDSKDIPRIPDIEELLEFTATKDNVFAIGTIDMDKDIAPQLARHTELFEQGKIVGIKLYPGYQYFYPHDAKVVEIGKLCEKYNKPLVFHTGDCFDPEDKAILKYAHPIHIDELSKKCPNTNIVIAHFGFPYLLEAANVVAANNNVYVDISAVLVDFKIPKNNALLQKQFTDDLKRVFVYFPEVKKRVLFGTDYAGEQTCLNLVEPYVQVILKLLNKEEQNNAFYKLAERLFF